MTTTTTHHASMARFVEFHALQSFPPGKLNAGDTGDPKTMAFADVTRAYVSSACFKRASRLAMREYGLLEGDNLATRIDDLVPRAAALVAQGLHTQGVDQFLAQAVLKTAFGGLGLGFKDDESARSQYLLFLPERVIMDLVDE